MHLLRSSTFWLVLLLTPMPPALGEFRPPLPVSMRPSGYNFEPSTGSIPDLLRLPSAPPPSTPTFRLEYSTQVGLMNSYRMRMQGSTTISVPGRRPKVSSVDQTLDITQRIQRFDGGIITLLTHPSPIGYGQGMLVEMRPNGEVISADTIVPIDLKSMQLEFPLREVKIGDSWTSKIPPTNSVPVELTATYHIEGIDHYLGHPCVRIGTTVSSPNEALSGGMTVRVQASGRIHFDLIDRVVASNVVESSMTVTSPHERIGLVTTDMRMSLDMQRSFATTGQ